MVISDQSQPFFLSQVVSLMHQRIHESSHPHPKFTGVACSTVSDNVYAFYYNINLDSFNPIAVGAPGIFAYHTPMAPH
jgi:hypothetical protein